MANPWPNVCNMMISGLNKLALGFGGEAEHPRHFYNIVGGCSEAGIWAKANGQKCAATNKCELYPQLKVPSANAQGQNVEIIISEFANLMDCLANKGDCKRPGGIWINGKKYLSKLNLIIFSDKFR